jgi:hypothetical protein
MVTDNSPVVLEVVNLSAVLVAFLGGQSLSKTPCISSLKGKKE